MKRIKQKGNKETKVHSYTTNANVRKERVCLQEYEDKGTYFQEVKGYPIPNERTELKLNVLLIINAAVFISILIIMIAYATGKLMPKWIIVFAASIVIITVSALSIVLLLQDRDEGMAECWNVELWNVHENYGIHFAFLQSMVIGRYTVLNNSQCDVPVREDTTISRNHILLYERNGGLWIRNMSKVNAAMLDGHIIEEPQQLRIGSRLKMGDSAFLVISMEKD